MHLVRNDRPIHENDWRLSAAISGASLMKRLLSALLAVTLTLAQAQADAPARNAPVSNSGSESVYAKLRDSIASARGNNPRVLGAMTSPPTITLSTATSSSSAPEPPVGLTQVFRFTADLFNVYGGRRVAPISINGTKYWCVVTNTAAPGTAKPNGYRFEVMVDAPKAAFRLWVAVPTNVKFLVAEDGKASRYAVTKGTMLTGNREAYVVLDFGSRKKRKIIVGLGGFGASLSSVTVAPTDNVFKAPRLGLRGAFLGDSYFSPIELYDYDKSMAASIADRMGVAGINLAQGGTGYINIGNSSNYQTRVADVIDNNPDFLVVASAANDQFAFTPAQITAAVSSVIRLIRANAPTANIPIFMLGAWTNHYGVTASNTAADKAVGAAVTAARSAGDRNVFWIPFAADPNGPWLTGTGNTGNRKGNGNLDVYGATDGSHLNAAGIEFAADRFVDKIADTVSKIW